VVASTMDLLGWLRKHLEDADTDLLREMVLGFVQALMGAEADALCGAPLGERSGDRVNQRNGYRPRRLDTRVGTLELAIPKLRAGSYYPDWLLERSPSGQDPGQRGGGVPRPAAGRRPVCVRVRVDALAVKCREAGRIVNVACVVATGVNADGHREILGLDVVTSEDGAGWTSFLRDLVARGLGGVELVISDAHAGLREAIAAVLPGASWQRCRTHFIRNLLCRVPKSAQGLVATLVRSIFAQPDAASTWTQHARIVDQLAERFPQATELLADAAGELLAFTAFPKEHWRQIWSNNPQERLNKELRRARRGGGDLPQPCRGSAPGRGGAGRAAR
jgi:putative transposase